MIKKDNHSETVSTPKKDKEIETPIKSGLKMKEDIVANWLPSLADEPFGMCLVRQ